jgi:hypothetical protein
MYSTLVALLLVNSAASTGKGLPSTINWVVVPCFRKWGISDAEAVETGLLWPGLAAKARGQMNVEQNRTRSFTMISFALSTSRFFLNRLSSFHSGAASWPAADGTLGYQAAKT